MDDNDKDRLFLLYHEILNKTTKKEKPTMPDDGRRYVWLEESSTWVDASPKKRHLVTFIRVSKNDD